MTRATSHTHAAPAALTTIAPLIVACCVGLLSIDGGFVYDDSRAILGSPFVQGEVPLSSGLETDFWGQSLDAPKTSWRPAIPFVWRVLWSLGNGSPVPFHVLSLVLHCCLVLGAYRLLRCLRIPYATVAACLIACHPLRSEAVGALVAHADLASMAALLFALADMIAERYRAWRSFVFFVLACLAKESAVLFAPLFLLICILRPPASRAGYVPPVLCLVFSGALTYLQLSLSRPDIHAIDNLYVLADGLGRILLAFHSVGRSLGLLFIPTNLAPNHGYAAVTLDITTLTPGAIGGLAATCIGVVGTIWSVRSRRLDVLTLLALGFAPLLLQSSLLVTSLTGLAERLLLGPVVAFCALAVQLGHVIRSNLRPTLTVAVITVYVLLSVPAQRAWTSEATLWAHAVDSEPLAIRSHTNRATTAFREGDLATYFWHQLVATWLHRQLPEPVDTARLERASAMTEQPKWLYAMGVLSPDGPCELAVAWLSSAFRDRQRALRAWAQLERKYRCPSLK
ncbi:MAG: hypothetical protein VX223_16855 [Myxococcota bacterium]|nr:hypothetical protein [Myxococcota bacterium]